MKQNNPILVFALALASSSASSSAQIPVDGGYTATPSTSIPAYEDTGGIELTDGDVGSLVWPDAGTLTQPLVGWQNIDATATFNFSAPVDIGSIVTWFADSDGNAGVGLPESVRVTTTGGFDELFPIPDPDGSGTTVGIELGGFNLTTDNVTLQIARDTALDNPNCCGGAYEWTMLSEVQFFGPVDPELPALIAPPSIDLGTIPPSPAAFESQFDISNVATATANLNITDISFGGSDAANFTLGNSPAALAPGSTGQVTFTFDSGGVGGTYEANIDITSNDVGSPTSIPIAVRVLAPLPPITPYQQAVLDLNPLLYWSFDEPGDTDNARCLADDVLENELVARGAATRAPSTTTAGGLGLGRAASFDGSEGTRFDAADLSDTSLPLTGIDQFALELWFKSNETSAQYLMETFTEEGMSNESSLIVGFNGHGLPDEFEIFSGDRSGLALPDPTSWHHAVVAHYGGGQLEIYVDGVSTVATGDYNSTQAFGRFAIGHTVLAPTNGFIGLIDEFAIYDLSGFGDLAAQRAHASGIAEHHSLTGDPAGFRITDISLEPGNRISLTWSSKPSATYSIFWSSDLGDFSIEVVDDVDSGGTSTTHIFDNPSIDFDNPEGLPALFLRVSENAD